MSGVGLMLTGIMVASGASVALFFLRFWKRSGDRLFAIFAAAFFLLAAHWCSRAFIQVENEDLPYYYLVRLAAFGLILFAIVDKNRRP